MMMAANDSADGIWILSNPPEIRENLKSTEIQLPPPCKNEKIGPRALISQMDLQTRSSSTVQYICLTTYFSVFIRVILIRGATPAYVNDTCHCQYCFFVYMFSNVYFSQNITVYTHIGFFMRGKGEAQYNVYYVRLYLKILKRSSYTLFLSNFRVINKNSTDYLIGICKKLFLNNLKQIVQHFFLSKLEPRTPISLESVESEQLSPTLVIVVFGDCFVY